MFQKLLAGYQKRKKVKKVKNTILIINKLIYDEKYDLNEESGMEKFIREISGPSDKISLIQIYMIVNRITRANIPIGDEGILMLNQELEDIRLKLILSPKGSTELNEAHLKKNKLKIQIQQSYLELEETKMHVNLLIRQQHIDNGKKKFKKDPYSFEGQIYKLEKVGKRPSSLEDLNGIKKSVDRMNESNLRLEEIQSQQKELGDEIETTNSLKDTLKDRTNEEIELIILKDSKLVSDLEKLQNGSVMNKNDLD